MANEGIIIVGGGHGGGNVAPLLRQAGYDGPIQIISAESFPPYHRPPLSKAFLKGESELDALRLRPDAFYVKSNIDLRLDCRVLEIDPAAKTIATDTAGTLAYEKLVIATGSTARALPAPGATLGGVHLLRTITDTEGFRTALGPGKRLAIIGGGYVGLEAAASARAMGADVIVIEREERVLARVACETLSTFFQTYHVGHGVEFLTGATVAALRDAGNGFVDAVVLEDGTILPCDAVLVGVGGLPCDALAREAGLACDNGIVVDLAGRTSAQDIYAIGDVTNRPLPHYDDRRMRLESVPNALDQARAVAADIMGKPLPASDLPWFWSDQYDLKLQIAGIVMDSDRIVVRGSPDAASFSIFHMKGDVVQCVEAVNAPGDFMPAKKLITGRIVVSDAQIADLSVPVKELASQAIS